MSDHFSNISQPYASVQSGCLAVTHVLPWIYGYMNIRLKVFSPYNYGNGTAY